MCCMLTDFSALQDSDGEKSEDNLVVDVSNEVSSCIKVVAVLVFFSYSLIPVLSPGSCLPSGHAAPLTEGKWPG